MDELLARFPEVPRDLRDEPILPEYVKAFGPLLRMAQKPSPCVGSSGDAQHVCYTRLVNDLAIYAIGLATRDRTLVRLQATPAQYRQQPPTFGHAQEVIPWPKLTARAGPRRGALAGDPIMTITIDLAETACKAALDSPVEGPDSATRAAIERAPKTTAGSKIRRVTCTLAEAKDMLEYFEHASSRLQVRGEYEKSTACAQALESIRRALQR